MSKLTNDEFIAFLETYKSKEGCFDSISNISWPKDKNGNNLLSKEPLIANDDLFMYSFDDMCKEGIGSVFNKDNLPSTTDALYYKINEDKMIIYFIEFKWSNLDNTKVKTSINELIGKLSSKNKFSNNDLLNKLMDLKKSSNDSEILFSLRLKPFESIFIVLPKLYKKYCEENNLESKDIYSFLIENEVKVLTFAGHYTEETNKINRHRERYRYNVSEGPRGTNGSVLNKQYKRLELTPFVDFTHIYSKSFFNDFVISEGF